MGQHPLGWSSDGEHADDLERAVDGRAIRRRALRHEGPRGRTTSHERGGSRPCLHRLRRGNRPGWRGGDRAKSGRAAADSRGRPGRLSSGVDHSPIPPRRQRASGGWRFPRVARRAPAPRGKLASRRGRQPVPARRGRSRLALPGRRQRREGGRKHLREPLLRRVAFPGRCPGGCRLRRRRRPRALPGARASRSRVLGAGPVHRSPATLRPRGRFPRAQGGGPPAAIEPPPPTSPRPPLRPGDWLCPHCKAHNFARRAACLGCQRARARPQLRAGDWLCPGCNAHNFARRQNCHQCNAARPS